VKLTTPINIDQTELFKGVADFYYWKGIPVCRSWPRPPVHPETTAQKATWQAFRDMITWKRSNPVSWHEEWGKANTPIGVSTEDAKRKQGLLLAYENTLEKPPDVVEVLQMIQPAYGYTHVRIQIQPYPGFDHTKVKYLARPRERNLPALDWTQHIVEGAAACELQPSWRPVYSTFRTPWLAWWSGSINCYITIHWGLETQWQVLAVPVAATTRRVAVAAPTWAEYPYG